MGKKLPKRFYKSVAISIVEDGYTVLLDGKTIKTPLREILFVKSKALAEVIASEWSDQKDYVNPDTMLFTKLANTAQDRVRGREADIINEIASYLASDLLCYRCDNPADLLNRQRKLWDPILEEVEENIGIRLETTNGIVHVDQPAGSMEAARNHLLGYDVYSLAAMHNITTMLGSAVLTLAHLNGFLTLDEIWRAAHVDEDWQIEQWGTDTEAAARRESRLKEVRGTSRFIELNRSSG